MVETGRRRRAAEHL